MYFTSLFSHLVRPEKLNNLRSSDGKVFSWSYPDTWEKPCSFFGLHFQGKVVKTGHTCDSQSYLMVIKQTWYRSDFSDTCYCKHAFSDSAHTFMVFNMWPLLLCSKISRRKLSSRWTSALRSMFSVWELRTCTPIRRSAPGAPACKYCMRSVNITDLIHPDSFQSVPSAESTSIKWTANFVPWGCTTKTRRKSIFFSSRTFLKQDKTTGVNIYLYSIYWSVEMIAPILLFISLQNGL